MSNRKEKMNAIKTTIDTLNAMYDSIKKAVEQVETKEVDWENIPVDTLVWVTNEEMPFWHIAHFAKYENGCVYTFPVCRTLEEVMIQESKTEKDALLYSAIRWDCCRLYKEGENPNE